MLLPVALVLSLAGCLFALALLRGRRARGRGFVAYHPAWRAFLRERGLFEPRDFLEWSAPLVSGHPDRNVARVELGAGAVAYLKREWRVPRWARLLGGRGLSRCVREARALEALERSGAPAPRWLAAGEDGCGRAFLLVAAVPGSVDLPALLTRLTGRARNDLARLVGAAVAGLHARGFVHGDLYARHVLCRPESGEVWFLDWQRSRCGRRLGLSALAGDLAALHATLPDRLAGPRLRLLALRAYLRGLPAAERPPLHALVAVVEARARRLLRRRHVREKRQAEAPAAAQAWVCLDGEALCVTPALRRRCSQADLARLRLEGQPPPRGGSVSRRWVALSDGAPALLVRRTGRCRQALWRGREGLEAPSPEQRLAHLMLRLERHAVPAPRALAMGRRDWPDSSFVLSEPPADTVSLEAWLARPRARPRGGVLERAGALLRKLHEANCYLAGGGALALGPGGEPALACVEGLLARRRPSASLARRDLEAHLRRLARAGCGPEEVERFRAGYAGPPDRPRPLPLPPARGPNVVNQDNLWRRLFRGTLRLRQRPDWEQFAGPGWADRIMAAAVTDRFHAKQGRSTGRLALTAAPEPGPPQRLTVYLKRHYRLPFWLGWLATLWPGRGWSPAFQEWDHLEWARRLGVPVPNAVAAGEWVGPGGRLQSFLAVEELTDMLPLHEAVPLAAAQLPAPTFRRWKSGLVAEMARLARLLHDRRCFHKDLYLCHFYVPRALTEGLPAGGEWRDRVHLIDLHRLAHHPWSWPLWQLKDLAQLLYSSEVPGVDARDRLLFWRHYRGPGAARRRDGWLRRAILFKWRRYRAHNLRRKARAAAAAA